MEEIVGQGMGKEHRAPMPSQHLNVLNNLEAPWIQLFRGFYGNFII